MASTFKFAEIRGWPKVLESEQKKWSFCYEWISLNRDKFRSINMDFQFDLKVWSKFQYRFRKWYWRNSEYERCLIFFYFFVLSTFLAFNDVSCREPIDASKHWRHNSLVLALFLCPSAQCKNMKLVFVMDRIEKERERGRIWTSNTMARMKNV